MSAPILPNKNKLLFCFATLFLIFAIICVGCRRVTLSERQGISDNSSSLTGKRDARVQKRVRHTAQRRSSPTASGDVSSEKQSPRNTTETTHLPDYRLVPVDPETLQPKTLKTYKVRKGDTLQEIAKKFYNQAKEWKTIFRYNQHKLNNPHALPAGVTLVIPPLP